MSIRVIERYNPGLEINVARGYQNIARATDSTDSGGPVVHRKFGQQKLITTPKYSKLHMHIDNMYSALG